MTNSVAYIAVSKEVKEYYILNRSFDSPREDPAIGWVLYPTIESAYLANERVAEVALAPMDYYIFSEAQFNKEIELKIDMVKYALYDLLIIQKDPIMYKMVLLNPSKIISITWLD